MWRTTTRNARVPWNSPRFRIVSSCSGTVRLLFRGEYSDHRVYGGEQSDSTVARRSVGSRSRFRTVALPFARAKRIQCRSPDSDPRVDTGVPNPAQVAAEVASFFLAHDELLRA